MTAKELFIQTAYTFDLNACGVASSHFSKKLEEQLVNAGPIPFAPTQTAERIDANQLLEGSQSFFVILFPYKPKEEEKGNIALYARPLDYHKIIHQYLEKIIDVMKEAYPQESFLPLVDTSPMVDRWLAYEAGLGFFGKNHCLIHPIYGSYVTIGSILTTLALPPDTPLSLSCGSCTSCMHNCPGQVIKETQFSPWQCKSYITQKKEDLTEKEKEILRRTPYIFGCDNCQTCCPYNQKAPVSPIPEIHSHRIVEITDTMLSSYSNRSFDKAFRSYAFAWRGKKVLLRNWNLLHSSHKE